MDSSSLQDVLGGRAQAQPEEVKEVPALNPAEVNDINNGEFRIEALRMKDSEAGQVLWESSQWDLTTGEEVKVEFPSSMLGCKAIGREIVFYSKKIMHDFSIR